MGARRQGSVTQPWLLHLWCAGAQLVAQVAVTDAYRMAYGTEVRRYAAAQSPARQREGTSLVRFAADAKRCAGMNAGLPPAGSVSPPQPQSPLCARSRILLPSSIHESLLMHAALHQCTTGRQESHTESGLNVRDARTSACIAHIKLRVQDPVRRQATQDPKDGRAGRR